MKNAPQILLSLGLLLILCAAPLTCYFMRSWVFNLAMATGLILVASGLWIALS